MSCDCFRWVLLALDEWKAHKEYSAMGEGDKAGDEKRHYQDFYERVKARCPETYKRIIDDIKRCEVV